MVVAVPAVAAAVVKTKVASAAAAKAMRATAVAVGKCILKKAKGWINPRPTNLIEKTYFVGVEVLDVILRKLEN